MGAGKVILAAAGSAWLLGRLLGGGRVVGAALDSAKRAAFAAALPERSRPYVNDILRVSDELGVSPVILWAIMEWESRSGTALSPPGPGGTGDAGHGRGLMQIDDRSNQEFLAQTAADGTPLWKIPYYNIREGAKILLGKLDFLARRPGAKPIKVTKNRNTPDEITYVIGAGGDVPDVRPLSGMRHLLAGLAAYNCGEANVLLALGRGLDVDFYTTPYKATGGAKGYSRNIVGSVTAVETKLAQAAS